MMFVFFSLLFCFVVIETGYRVLDPFPYFSDSVTNNTEHGNLLAYDHILGWKGVPLGEADFITKNNKVRIAHNRYGYRDTEHKNFPEKKPAIVFLGDSFTWGYEVEFEEMFVNRLRDTLPNYEIYNLAHRGYGTDQALLTFKDWFGKQSLKLVVLMFSENDVADNNSLVRYRKPKPKYQLVENELELIGVPVPKDDRWAQSSRAPIKPKSWRKMIKEFLYHSHFFHDVHFRLQNINKNKNKNVKQDLTLTSRILKELKAEVERRGAKFVVALIPSKVEIEKLGVYTPYQIEIVKLCQQLDIECLDIAPKLKNTWYRTYYRLGMHWNMHGHKIAAEALDDFVARTVIP